jgi:antitoxin FitA
MKQVADDIIFFQFDINGAAMAQVVVRNLDEHVKQRLKRRAAKRGHSMEAEIREILGRAVNEDSGGEGLGTFIARQFAGKGHAEIPEWHGEPARPAKFRK